MLDAVARSGMSVTENMAKQTDAYGRNVYSQGQLQANLVDTFNKTKTAAGQFGITGTAADNLARDILGIPRGVDIKSWMSDYAKRMAEQTLGAMNAVDGKTVNTYVNHHETTFIRVERSESVHNSTGAAAGRSGARTGFWTGGAVRHFDGGGFNGPVFGPGTGTSDSIFAALSNGEFVMKAAAVNHYGLPLMEALNSGTVPSGMAHAPATSNGYAGSAGTAGTALRPVINVTVEVPGMSERFTAKIRDVSTQTISSALQELSNGRNSSQKGVYIS
ncbi:hypothetical protein [Arthrobacter sp. QXT-31]|uniref:hypothetical protein n=1 Tax=Arthrobacter sp. QXT-31 TaxID=1357915 RepID=UPI0009717C7A|nr:hypothetical protein [Arthrobacter sp. QXT-31]APX02909.1 hypothetical protein BWQ92_15380 [Arthrobacter sp. QXT-31]